MKKYGKFFCLCLLLSLSIILTACSSGGAKQQQGTAGQEAPPYYRVVIASDVHYPSKTSESKKPQVRQEKIDNKLKAAQDIDSWKDVSLVVFTGDLVELTGSEDNYQKAKVFADKITKQKAFVLGNHEFMYGDALAANGKLQKADKHQRDKKQKLFKQTFGVKNLYYSQTMGKYLLIFLAPDMDNPTFLTEMSQQELQWLKDTLEKNKDKPTICFFHAPLAGTLDNYTAHANKPNFIAQPRGDLDTILKANPQIKLWVSGHTHTPVTVPCFASPVNYYAGTKILDVQNPTWDGKQVWTNSLYLYPDKIEIKTYDHKAGKFLDNFNREVPLK